MYGVASAPAIWKRTIESILNGIPEIAVFLDDIRISRKNLEEHMKRLEFVLKRLSEHISVLIKVNFLKTVLVIVSMKLVKMEFPERNKKIEAVRKMPKPNNITELRAFIGLINYYGRFITPTE